MTIRESIEKAIAQSGMTKKEIALRLGVNYSQFCNFVKGTGSLSGRYFDQIFDILGLEVRIKPKKQKRYSLEDVYMFVALDSKRYDYDECERYIEEAGWQSWMNDFVEKDEPTERELKDIEKIQREAFFASHQNR